MVTVAIFRMTLPLKEFLLVSIFYVVDVPSLRVVMHMSV